LRDRRFDQAEAVCTRIAAIWPDHPKLAATRQQIAEARLFQQKIDRIRELIKQGDKTHAKNLVQLALTESPNSTALLELKRELAADEPAPALGPVLDLLGQNQSTWNFAMPI
jgi:hypothetical protein